LKFQGAALFSLFSGLAVCGGCHGKPGVERRSAADSSTRHALGRELVAAPGIVEPWGGELRLAGLEPGVLSELHVREGQRIEQGALLARLEDSQQRHAVALAAAELRQADAELGGARASPEDVRVAEAELTTAELRANQQRREAERAESLGVNGVIPAADLERQLSSLTVAEATAEAARARLLVTRRGARSSERRLAEARLEAAEVRLASARAALTRREIRSPISGVVVWSRYQAGEFYAQGEPLMILGDVERLQVRIEVDDVDADALSPGAPCQLRDDGGGSLGDGTLLRLAVEYASRGLRSERPSERTDARVREGFVEINQPTTLAPGRRVWAYCHKPQPPVGPRPPAG
jgi:multidrug efflux pump subunit AcrA (membrane-fusion protein)